MSIRTLSRSFKVCATCALWDGDRTATYDGFLKFEETQRGKCCGGSFNNAKTPPLAKCDKWAIWPPIR